jgi:hypothetical protein
MSIAKKSIISLLAAALITTTFAMPSFSGSVDTPEPDGKICITVFDHTVCLSF